MLLNGDVSVEKRQFEVAPSINDRINRALFGLYSARTAPTGTMREQYTIAKEEFEPIKSQLRDIVNTIKDIEARLEAVKAPYTPGRTSVIGN